MKTPRKMISVTSKTFGEMDTIKLLSGEQSWDSFFENIVIKAFKRESAKKYAEKLFENMKQNTSPEVIEKAKLEIMGLIMMDKIGEPNE